MKTILISLIIMLLPLYGNSQNLTNFKQFKIEKSELDSTYISLEYKCGKKIKSTDKSGIIHLKENAKEYADKINRISNTIFKNNELSFEIKKRSRAIIYFNNRGDILKFNIMLDKNMLTSTTEQEWMNWCDQIKRINLLDYIEIENKDNFKFGSFSFKIF